MSDFYEIDFLSVNATRSGDAIAIRYRVNDLTTISVVDGGFQETGDQLASFIRKYYNDAKLINNVVVTHPDGDHAGGLGVVLAEFKIGTLWMLRPWEYADELIERFSRFRNVDSLRDRLREIYPTIADLEEVAISKGIDIREPFSGAQIGAFRVLSPSKNRYLELIVESDKTPEQVADNDTTASGGLRGIFEAAVSLVRSAWGIEIFSKAETSSENEMSVVQLASLCDDRILLTGDAGRQGLTEAADYARDHLGLRLPGIKQFQVPHHGSRRNVSSEVLDQWLGQQLFQKLARGSEEFNALVSAAKKDTHHPRRAVVRAMIHRGGLVASTEGKNINVNKNAPSRTDYGPVEPLPYPDDQESQ